MSSQRLRAQDATLLYAQDRRAPLLIGAVCHFEREPLVGPDGRLRIEDLRAHLSSRLHLVPRFRQRLALVPGDSGRPRWVDDTDFDIRNHAHTAELPTPGGPRELHAFVAELLAVPLDPRRPLWDLWILDGLDGDRVAVVLVVSHVMADGLALLGFALALLDADPDAAARDATAVGARAGALRGPSAGRCPPRAGPDAGRAGGGRRPGPLPTRTARRRPGPARSGGGVHGGPGPSPGDQRSGR